MRVIADLHIHSKYARACSKDLTPENLALWADKKGIGILGTGDFTHPGWFADLGRALEESEPGLYRLKDGGCSARFVYQTEIASIYKQGVKVRRQHSLVFAPNREAAAKVIVQLEKLGCNLKSDGRPIVGVHLPDLVKLIKDVDESCELIPAHAWTPHFGLFGSLSGFDSLEEAFGEQARYIWAIETGLSSDPAMNWQVPQLDNITLISNSDPHSLHRLGREANVLEMQERDFSYAGLMHILKDKNPDAFTSTIEFFPEEGRYHLDGHRDCKYSATPEQTRKLGGACPVCGKQLLKGVQHRVEVLGTRQSGFALPGSVPFTRVLPLEEAMAQALGVGPSSKKVQMLYNQAVLKASEFSILLNLSGADLSSVVGAPTALVIEKVRRGNVKIEPGYDGQYGVVEVFTEEERRGILEPQKQLGLF